MRRSNRPRLRRVTSTASSMCSFLRSRLIAVRPARGRLRVSDGDKPPLITWSRSSSAIRRIAQFGLGDHRVAFVCPDVSSQIAMAEQGLGIVIVPDIFGTASSKLQRLGTHSTIGGRSVWVLTHPDLHRSIRIKAVTGFLTTRLRAILVARNTGG